MVCLILGCKTTVLKPHFYRAVQKPPFVSLWNINWTFSWEQHVYLQSERQESHLLPKEYSRRKKDCSQLALSYCRSRQADGKSRAHRSERKRKAQLCTRTDLLQRAAQSTPGVFCSFRQLELWISTKVASRAPLGKRKKVWSSAWGKSFGGRNLGWADIAPPGATQPSFEHSVLQYTMALWVETRAVAKNTVHRRCSRLPFFNEIVTAS